MRKIISKFFPGFILLATICICGSGCASISMDSTKDAAAVHKLQRLYIFINQPQLPPSFSQSLATAFQNCLSNSPVELNMSAAKPLVLDERSYDSQIEAFHPDDVLVVKVQIAFEDQLGGYPKIIYDVSLFDNFTKKREWRAVINNFGDVSATNRRMKEMAQSIVSQLKLDGFL